MIVGPHGQGDGVEAEDPGGEWTTEAQAVRELRRMTGLPIHQCREAWRYVQAQKHARNPSPAEAPSMPSV